MASNAAVPFWRSAGMTYLRSGLPTRFGLPGQPQWARGRISHRPVKFSDQSSSSFSQIPKKYGASENFRGPTRFFGKTGTFAQASSLPSTMKFASSIHSVGPKEFERGINDGHGPIEIERNPSSIDTDRNRPPNENFGIFEGSRNRPPVGNPGIVDGFRSRTPVRNPGTFERNAGNYDDLSRRLTDVERNQPSIGRDARPFWRDIRPAESGRGTSSMNFVRGIMRDNLTDFQGPGPNPEVEHNADIVHIKIMRNNTFVTVTDSKGNKKTGTSAGCLAEMKGGPKVSKYAAEATAEHVGRAARSMGLKSVVVKVNGFTFFKRKKLAVLGFRDGYTHSRSDQNPVVYVEDTTRKPHNGCRRRKKRRV